MGRFALIIMALTVAVSVNADTVRGKLPDGFLELPALTADTTAADTGSTGFGDPTRGVFLLRQEVALPEGKKPADLVPRIVQALEKKGFQSKASTPTSVSFTIRDTAGRVVVSAVGARAQVTTCFYNARERQRSSATCSELLSKNK